MKTISLSQFAVSAGEGQKDISIKYLDFMKAAVNQQKQGGFSPDDIEKRLRILDVLNKAKNGVKSVKFEDSDYTYFQQLVKEQRFMFVHEGIGEYLKAMENAKSD